MSEKYKPSRIDSLSEVDVPVNTNSEATWLLSYSDIVTLLLCFFMLFYSSEKTIPKMKKSTTILADIEESLPGSREGEKGGTGKGAGTVGASNVNAVDDSITALPERIAPLVEDLKYIEGSEISKENEYIKIEFKNKTFFNLGRSKLNDEGKRIVDSLKNRLLPFASQIKITITGHTDPTPVQTKEHWWKDNMELSLARALSVRRRLITNGFPENNLIVSGEAFYRMGNPLQAPDDIKNYNRKVTLKIEAK